MAEQRNMILGMNKVRSSLLLGLMLVGPILLAASPPASDNGATSQTQPEFTSPTSTSKPTPAPGKSSATTPSVMPEIVVTGKAEESNTAAIDPSLGTRVYKIDSIGIQNLPQGADTSFDQLVDRTPGVNPDAFGQWHIRGEDYNSAYQINGIRIPQGIVNSTFGEQFDTRFIRQLSLIDGALPAQYGLNTAGIFDIQSQGADLEGGEVSLYGGSHAALHPSFSYGGVSGKTDYFFQGSYNQNNLGVENPTGSSSAIHDETKQYKGFAYSSTNLDPTSQLIIILSSSDSDFQIPNTPGLPVAYSLPDATSFSSAALNQTQNDQFDYGIISYKKTIDDLEIQTSLVNSYARTLFRPDINGDLLLDGVASQQNRSLLENSFYNDVTYQLNDKHTLRGGVYFTAEAQSVASSTEVFQTDSTGNVISDLPETIQDGQYKRGYLFGIYVQDEWKVCDSITVNYGVRFDESREYVNENQFSPRINLTYTASPETTFHIGYARYFTPPQLEYLYPSSLQKYANTTNAPEVFTDDQIHAERANYYDTGLIHQVSKEWQIGLDGYYKSVRNQVDEAQLGDSLIYAPYTYQYGYVVGTELTSNYSKDGFTTYSNLAVSRAEARQINSGQYLFGQDELNYVAQHDIHVNHDQLITLSTGASYTFQNTTAHIDALLGTGFYDGFANLTKVPSHYPVNLGLVHQFKFSKTDSLSVRFDVINVFDQTYKFHDGSGIGITAAEFGARRAYYGGVSYSF